MRTKFGKKEEAANIARELLQTAIDTAKTDLRIAKKQASLARKILMRFNIRLGYQWSRFICHGCKELIVPGVNARVRLNREKKSVIITCLSCGHVNRKILGQA